MSGLSSESSDSLSSAVGLEGTGAPFRSPSLYQLVIAVLAGIFQATFTLPGMAALILTIGMAVDANILIFERIREELKAGKNSENALSFFDAIPKNWKISSQMEYPNPIVDLSKGRAIALDAYKNRGF